MKPDEFVRAPWNCWKNHGPSGLKQENPAVEDFVLKRFEAIEDPTKSHLKRAMNAPTLREEGLPDIKELVSNHAVPISAYILWFCWL
jgi:hypothetical protein